MIKVRVPATTANCSIGFDCLGMALDWWSTFSFEASDTNRITGCDPAFQNEDNLVLQAFYSTCDYLKKEHPALHIDIDSTLPSSRGFGSSAMCIVAGIVGANTWFKNPLTMREMLEIATRFEGHPDNVAPALVGALSVSFMQEDHIYSTNISCANWHLLAMVPDEEVPTQQARKVLPKTLPFDYAKQQVAYALSFIQAIQNGDLDLLLASCHDFLHEPYRKKLISSYDKIYAFCQEKQIPMWISGSGSTMIGIHLDQKPLLELKEYVEGLGIFCKEIQISQKGAYVVHE